MTLENAFTSVVGMHTFFKRPVFIADTSRKLNLDKIAFIYQTARAPVKNLKTSRYNGRLTTQRKITYMSII